ncbi:threonine synthase [Ferrovibrio terrae]|uniref:Threonine synthase n=1 Tax=Ferrovibrio terrae TaxID=2594003 RepID=A0A516GYU5_9PROT|nr:threonine synthase [Ferrovibrio terrae]QDO96699.1 threonine synthase [Ferrovibrio terrae]
MSFAGLVPETPNFVTHLECGMTGEKLPAGQLHNLSPQGFPILVRYDLAGVKKALTREKLASRAPNWWRYRELLPVRKTENVVSLGEVMTPLLNLPRLAKKHGATGDIIVKDEGRLPTGSFKARGLALAVCMAKELGVTKMAMPTNGNAGAALAAYASRAGIESVVFCPDDTPQVNMNEIVLQGARLYKVNGLINDCGKLVGAGKETAGWFDTSTLKEPYRIEGKKTMGLELAEQLGWELPDAIFYPTGGGTGLIGMWKAFEELEAIGFIGSKRPKMIAVQATGCAPIVRAWEGNERHAKLWENAHTVAAGIRVPAAIGDFLILDAVRNSNGFALAVEDAAITAALDEVAKEEGFLMCPEGAATYAAWKQALSDGRVKKSDRVVLWNCAAGLKYPMADGGTPLDRHGPIDYAKL